MLIAFPTLGLGIKVAGLTAIAVTLFSANITAASAQLAMIGQQYFADGTGIAYFNDGTKEPFSHTLTADEGYYYDESTPFYLDTIPEVGNNTGSVVCGNIEALEQARQAAATNSSRTMPPSTNDNSGILGSGNITTITIIRGASLLSDKSRAVDPNPIVHIKVNDTLTWLNQDTTSHWLTSPPMSFGSNLPSVTFINTFISSNGGTYSCTFTEAGGYHYTLGNDIKGAVIVEGNGSTPTEQVQQPASTSSLFSQQLQSQQEQESAQQSQSQLSLNQGGSVSIMPGSSGLTTDAYVPNPIQVSVGGTVTWTNDDSQPHTATSGENATPDGDFDSGIMAPAATFEHTFEEAGEYPYFCLLHPNMVGTVSVTAGSGSSSDTTSSANNTTSTAASSAIANNNNTAGPLSGITDPLQNLFGGSANNTTSTAASSAIANNNNTAGPLSGITDPLQNLFGGGDQTTGSGGSSSTNTGSSTLSSSPPPTTSGSSSRCPDGYHRSPSGDCERVTDTRGMPRCPDGYHRSPSGNCEYVG